ncbi:MAG: cation diffusion facilitator family transporter [Rhodovibrionaceae bacterium]|nr:cation diffusion facilitator family transporter [Rhodovibrionaceae bacterium]
MAGPKSKKVIYAALAGNALIAVTKFFAAAYTGSSAMVSEGIHSLVDTGNQGLLLHGLRRAKQEPDRDHPFGYGMELYFWTFVVAILIFAVGAGISIYEGVNQLMDPHIIEDPYINYIVLALAMVFEGFAWTVAMKEFRRVKGKRGIFEEVRRSKDPTLFTVLFEDTAAMLGLVAAFIGIAAAQVLGIPEMDAVASLVIGAILALTAVMLAYESKGLLVGESALPHVVGGIREIAGGYDEIERVNEVLTMHMGPRDVLVNLSLDFKNDLSAGAVEKTVTKIERAVKKEFDEVTRIFVEAQSRQSHTAELRKAKETLRRHSEEPEG